MARPQPRLAAQGTLIHHRLAPAALARAAETRRRCSSDSEGDTTARRIIGCQIEDDAGVHQRHRLRDEREVSPRHAVTS